MILLLTGNSGIFHTGFDAPPGEYLYPNFIIIRIFLLFYYYLGGDRSSFAHICLIAICFQAVSKPAAWLLAGKSFLHLPL